MMPKRLAQVAFVVACGGLAWYAWASWSVALPQYKNEVLVVPTFLLYMLTLPASLVIQLISTGLTLILPIDRLDAGTGFLNWMFKTWMPLTIAGYWQWFTFVPRLLRRWRTRGATSSTA